MTNLDDYMAAQEPISEAMAILKNAVRMIDHSVNYAQHDSASDIRSMLDEADRHLKEAITCFAI